MRKQFWVSLMVFLVLGFKPCLAYEKADKMQFPLISYSRMGNIVGTYNAVGNNKYHLGEDVRANAGTNVLALSNGIVKHARNHPATTDADGKLKRNYGGMYIIEHTLISGKKICSLYAHLNFGSFAKKENDDVAIGDYLGQIGTTAQNGGWSEHLHFGIYNGSYPSNPDAYVCGDWIFSGYSACKSTLDSWLDPTRFINYPYTLNSYFRAGNVAWYPANVSCMKAQRWVYFSQGYPNGGMCLGTNSICVTQWFHILTSLGLSSADTNQVVYGSGDITPYLRCGQ